MSIGQGSIRLFEKKEGRDQTAKLFWKYVRNMAFLLLAAIITTLAVSPYEAFAFAFIDLIIMIAVGFYSLLSLRVRKLEERVEAGRTV